MERRSFLTMLGASTFAAAASTRSARAGQSADQNHREYYELRRYRFQNASSIRVQPGPNVNLADDFFRDALVPGLNRLGIKPVGVFTLTIGPDSPSVYVLIPSSSLETLVTAPSRLERDAAYLKTGEAFLKAPAKEPAYLRMESSLLRAFEGMPRLTMPASAENRPRMFELRTYESPSDYAHQKKVEMFNRGEMESFRKAGFWGVFYAASLIGPRLPNLTYMVGFFDLADRDKKWAAFKSEPDWKKLSALPRYTGEAIVSNVTNVILTPTPYSQI